MIPEQGTDVCGLFILFRVPYRRFTDIQSKQQGKAGNDCQGCQNYGERGYETHDIRLFLSVTHVASLSYQFQIKALSSLARLRLLSVLIVRLRRLNPRRLDFILDLKLE